MYILHLSTSDLDGGAARAAYRLHQSLLKSGTQSKMLVRAKDSCSASVIADKSLMTKVGPFISSWPLKLYSKRSLSQFSSQWFLDSLQKKIRDIDPDIVHLHWICNGFLNIETLSKIKKPLVWTLHDMWPFTGGCHYSHECTAYENACGYCPILQSKKLKDLSYFNLKRKQKAWNKLNMTLVAPSNWVAEAAQKSSLFKNRNAITIPHGLDLKIFRPIDKTIARDLLEIPHSKLILLFGAASGITNDPRKGFHLLKEALIKLQNTEMRDKLYIIIFGPQESIRLEEVGFPSHSLGFLSDELTLTLAYSAADLVATPSMQETYGQTVSEALACGTPVIAFNATGPKDIITHLEDGYLATPFDTNDFANGIHWILEDLERLRFLSRNARISAEKRLSSELQAKRHIELYRSLIDNQ